MQLPLGSAHGITSGNIRARSEQSSGFVHPQQGSTDRYCHTPGPPAASVSPSAGGARPGRRPLHVCLRTGCRLRRLLPSGSQTAAQKPSDQPDVVTSRGENGAHPIEGVLFIVLKDDFWTPSMGVRLRGAHK
ncbi:hypothetical protein NDU88_001348 [Pleurodeles waltl]|uniref:Uncharacterized protein n=1 Tax=Pleurodeles waltl TaxID=8319 RepID=A0AAV7NAH4_PLEWA|nr:hypothetical protein NDU88_001348 [Pleurodeles waltl]